MDSHICVLTYGADMTIIVIEQCHRPIPIPLRWGLPIEKAVSGEYNLPVRMHGRVDDEVIDQPTLFKRHV